MKKTLYSMLGCVGVALGAAGVVLPVLPTVPFLMLAAFLTLRGLRKSWKSGSRIRNYIKIILRILHPARA